MHFVFPGGVLHEGDLRPASSRRITGLTEAKIVTDIGRFDSLEAVLAKALPAPEIEANRPPR